MSRRLKASRQQFLEWAEDGYGSAEIVGGQQRAPHPTNTAPTKGNEDDEFGFALLCFPKCVMTVIFSSR